MSVSLVLCPHFVGYHLLHIEHIDSTLGSFSAKIPFGENSDGENSVRRNFRSAKFPFGENSVRREFRSAKIPSAKIPSAKIPSAKIPSAFFPISAALPMSNRHSYEIFSNKMNRQNKVPSDNLCIF